MAKVIIVYASLGGNTEEMAEAVAAGVREAGIAPELQSVLDVEAPELEGYDAVALGAYTWGDGDLPDEFLDFYDGMDTLNLDGRICTTFGSADSSYPMYGAAVDLLADKLLERGAAQVLERLKIELAPSIEELGECRATGRRLAEALLAAQIG
ncbi:flavodoxin [Paenibacillus sp. IB182496]|uniref:Flavodoxin n=1 Tax=Paenibacillus sabuli TaxID=2772509 RepID=A0A927GU75_9BACL|nr:flavodoxin [Paenibacillus sabuli]MBD2847860.1 flavodoxin [Paenibacillus sabuli]